MVLYPNEGALFLANTARTALAVAILHLYKDIGAPISPSTVLADFTEADYSGYAVQTITTWLTSYLDPAGGASIQSGTHQFNYVPPGGGPVANIVKGFYLEDATGKLIVAGNFDNPITMTALGDAIPVNITLNFGKS